MRLEDRDLTRLWKTLFRIERRLRLDAEKMADLLELTSAQYRRLSESRGMPSALSVLGLAKRLDLDPAQLIDDRIDWGALQQRFLGNAAYVPERYRVGAFSRRRTSIHILSHLRRRVGEDFVHDLLRKFDMTEAVFDSPDEFINLLFLTDLTNHLAAEGVTREQLVEMGAESSSVNRHTELGRSLAKTRSFREVYDLQIGDLTHHYDRNFRYRLLRLTSRFVLFEATVTQELVSALGLKRPGSDASCATRCGVATAVPVFAGFAPARVEEIRCVHRGDPTCQYACSFVERRRRDRPRLAARAVRELRRPRSHSGY